MSAASLIFGPTSPANRPLPRPRTLVASLICVLATAGCCSKSGVVVSPDPVRLTPPPAELMVKREPNLRQRLEQLSGPSQPTETPPSDN